MKPRAILFDFDGVIGDTKELCFKVSSMFHAGMTREQYYDYFIGNIHHATSVTPENFYNEYGKNIEKQAVIKGMDKVIKDLSNNFEMVIISSGSKKCIIDFLRYHDLEKYFISVLGYEQSISKTQKIQDALQLIGAENNGGIFITDTTGDIIEATKANVDSIGVTWGFHKETQLQSASPWALAYEPEDLVSLIELYFAGTLAK